MIPPQLVATAATVALMCVSVSANDNETGKRPARGESLQAVKREYDLAVEAWRKSKQSASHAGKTGDRPESTQKQDLPNYRFSPRFLAIAEKDLDGPEAVAALKNALDTGFDPETGERLPVREQALRLIQTHYIQKPAIGDLIPAIGRCAKEDRDPVFAELIARNPDRGIQAMAYREQIAKLAELAWFADFWKDPKCRALSEEYQGKDWVKEMLPKAEKARIELATMTKTYSERYGDVFPDLSIGQAAPEVVLESISGKPASLHALRGKVVVLDIWTTSCGPCKAMIPHERTMVERLKGKPFELVSISADDTKQMLIEFVAKEQMAWTHWWCGAEGPFVQAWDVRAVPVIYVLDAKGVIRYKNVAGEALEKAVTTLLAEMTTAPKDAASK
jgi:thiol-disulfide isomerase/thioredoxin